MTRVLGAYDSDDPLATSRDDTAIRTAYEAEDAWGLSTSIDLHHCDPRTISDPAAVERFTIELCELIGMNRFGDCVVVNFGEDPRVSGLSLVQLIETSCITGHFADQTGAAYPDIFSCKYYNPWVVAEFARAFFGATDYSFVCVLRK